MAACEPVVRMSPWPALVHPFSPTDGTAYCRLLTADCGNACRQSAIVDGYGLYGIVEHGVWVSRVISSRKVAPDRTVGEVWGRSVVGLMVLRGGAYHPILCCPDLRTHDVQFGPPLGLPVAYCCCLFPFSLLVVGWNGRPPQTPPMGRFCKLNG